MIQTFHTTVTSLFVGLFLLALLPQAAFASAVVPTGCVVVGSLNITTETFTVHQVIPDPTTEDWHDVDLTELVTTCKSEIAGLTDTEAAIGGTLSVSENDFFDLWENSNNLVVPVSDYAGSMGADGNVYGGGVQLEWQNARALAPENWLLQVNAAGMAGGVAIWATDQYIAVTDTEFGTPQCSTVRAFTGEEQMMLTEAVAALPHATLAELERPACAACADGDYDATLSVTHEGVSYRSSSFDLNQPHAEVVSLMDAVNEWAVAMCPDLPIHGDGAQPLPQDPIAEPDATSTTDDRESERRSIQQQIVELLQQVLDLLRLR